MSTCGAGRRLPPLVLVRAADPGQGNADTVNHAEPVLARTVALNFAPDCYVYDCKLYTNVEPCSICAGIQEWPHIGRLGYGPKERRLLDLTGNRAENPTISVPCREVFAHGQKTVRARGQVAEVEAEFGELRASICGSHQLATAGWAGWADWTWRPAASPGTTARGARCCTAATPGRWACWQVRTPRRRRCATTC